MRISYCARVFRTTILTTLSEFSCKDMKHLPKISIVVPISGDLHIYKYWLAMQKCDTFDTCEHIFVLNRPTDQIRDYILSIEKYFEFVHSVEIPERNLQIARNMGIQSARNDWIIHLDSDVQVNKAFIKEIHDAITQNPQALVIVPRLLREKGTSWWQYMMSKHYEILANRERPPVHNPGLVVNKSVYKNIGLLDHSYKYGNDNDFKRKIKTDQIAYARKAIVVHCADSRSKSIRQYFKYGIDRSRISRRKSKNERNEILYDRFIVALFIPKFLKNLHHGFQIALFEGLVGVITSSGFWLEECAHILPHGLRSYAYKLVPRSSKK